MDKVGTTALGTAATAIALTAAPANAAGTAQAACDPALVTPAGSLIGALWRSSGGERSVYGCQVTKEYGYAGKRGSYQAARGASRPPSRSPTDTDRTRPYAD